ncbi:PIN domain-containing protein [Bradyrhizobium sp. WSM471]|uniref:PIN domain-containing protein n=1 Tax=Bradyrhizobium sp. WSM471 TaxID=319017 RepID=UPI000568B58F|nr:MULTISPECIES: PIN domain-containing protein [Bradyrhizobium]UFW41692.1 PIN domain-containing protein [Bradyrhizobium canariense]
MFVDTQALRKARFDWNGRALSKLAEFAKAGQLRLLVTDITIGEVKSQLRELFVEASSSVMKHSGILEQLGASLAVERVRDQTTAISTLEAAFDGFLKHAKAVKVPLISDVNAILDDYFARRPPFSAKKKAEFPDAISVASIRRWCQQNSSTAYVVSDDPDLRGCCSEAGPLFHSESIAEIISQATVSQEVHDALEKALGASEYLSDSIIDEIKGFDVEYSRYNRAEEVNIIAARVEDVYSVNVLSLNVLEQEGQTFTCEPEIEVEVSLGIEVEVQGRYDEYEPSRHHWISQTRTEYFYPEVVLRFDQLTGNLEFDSISLAGQTVQVSINEINSRSFRW